jgi:hypothetical protein
VFFLAPWLDKKVRFALHAYIVSGNFLLDFFAIFPWDELAPSGAAYIRLAVFLRLLKLGGYYYHCFKVKLLGRRELDTQDRWMYSYLN